jgi:cytidylate kinase
MEKRFIVGSSQFRTELLLGFLLPADVIIRSYMISEDDNIHAENGYGTARENQKKRRYKEIYQKLSLPDK